MDIAVRRLTTFYAPKFVLLPFEEMESISRRRHETANKRFKQFGALKQTWRHQLCNHGKAFRVAAILAQLCIENGEPHFSVDYVDPNWDEDYIAQMEYGPDLAAQEL